MSEKLLPPEAEVPAKRVLRTWKWIGLAVFVFVLSLRQWLPPAVVALGAVYGAVVIINLVFHFLRYLKNRLFWRVRHRILGSFIFIGLIPLLLLLGVIYLSGRLLLGQLAANYLETSLREIEREVSGINVELAPQISPGAPAPELDARTARAFAPHAERFPRLAARLVGRRPDGTFETVWSYDPQEVTKGLPPYAAEKWLGEKSSFEGLLQSDVTMLMTALRPVPQQPDYYLDVSAPLDRHIEERLLREKSIYAAFSASGDVTVKVTGTSAVVRMKDKAVEKQVEERVEALELLRAHDRRRMITWVGLPESRDYSTGEKKLASVAVFHVPLEVLYQAYLAGSYVMGKFLLYAILVLLGLFVGAELVSTAIGLAISRHITRSVHDMYQGTLALQKGDLTHRIPVRRTDQLGLLAHSFNQMSSSITRLLEEVSEKKRLEQELEIAREVQATLFPKQLPQARGLSIFGGCVPAAVVSGDYYDFILEDESQLHVAVGDISGKGISAALLMANLQAAMRNQLLAIKPESSDRSEQRLADVMVQLNRQIYRNSPSEKYVTLFSGRYDAETHRLSYCNAGHLPPILLSGGEIKRLETGGTVLGLLEEADYQAGSIDLARGTVLVIFTDGITEAVNDAGEEFGEERLIAALRAACSRSPEAIYQYVIEQVRQWQGHLKQHDDITLVVGKVE